MKYIPWLVILLVSCTGNPSGNNMGGTTDSAATIHNNLKDTIARNNLDINAQCFQRVIQKDTATLKLIMADTIVTGELQYLAFEKDHNNGTIRGIIRDSVIYADYTFESEGMTSVREVVFKFKENKLLEAYGNVQEQDGKVIFKNRNTLQYIPEPFVKKDCLNK